MVFRKRPAANDSVEQSQDDGQAAKKSREEDNVEVEVVSAVLKRPAAKESQGATEDASDEKPEAEALETVGADKEQVNEEEALARQEEETVAARRKELKTTNIDTLKQLLEAQGLELGKKEDMIQRLVAHEAATRAQAREHQARIRQVFVDKKEELEALTILELRDRCTEEGVKGGQMTKQARIEALIKQWQEDDGVDKALAKMAHDARESELASMDAQALKELCEKAGIDPLLKEVMVDRIVKCENSAGRFGRPTLEREKKETLVTATGGDMVDALLASEANRKREREMQKQEEEAAAKRRADLKNKSLEELKKQIVAKGREALGKKDDLIEILLQVGLREEAAAKRRVELRAMEVTELKKLLQSKALELSSKKEDMVETFLAYEADICEAALGYSLKVDAALSERKSEWEKKTGSELKDMCASKDLKAGVSKEACLERLLEDLRASGEIDEVLATETREKRRTELHAKDKETLVKSCIALEINPLVKEVMVERILSYEDEFGRVKEPAIKKARKIK